MAAKKNLMLPNDDQLPTTLIPTTIAKLAALKPPADPDAEASRRVPGIEDRLWSVRAQLVGVREESDSDYHLILRDPVTHQEMVAEIPAPFCTSSPKKSYFERARQSVDQIAHHKANQRWWWLDYRGAIPPTVIVTGYAFFDREHDVDGALPNFIELHPILSVEVTQ
jgi:hypothetical protein